MDVAAADRRGEPLVDHDSVIVSRVHPVLRRWSIGLSVLVLALTSTTARAMNCSGFSYPDLFQEMATRTDPCLW